MPCPIPLPSRVSASRGPSTASDGPEATGTPVTESDFATGAVAVFDRPLGKSIAGIAREPIDVSVRRQPTCSAGAFRRTFRHSDPAQMPGAECVIGDGAAGVSHPAPAPSAGSEASARRNRRGLGWVIGTAKCHHIEAR